MGRARRSKLPIVLMALAVVFVSAALAGEGVKARPYRVGVLNEALAANHPTVEGLKAGLSELGFHEGRDVVFDIRFTKGDPRATPAEAGALVKAGVDLLFTSNEAATRAAKAASRTVPVVFTLVGDPVRAGVVSELARPGGNVTGVSSLTTELLPKRLELLRTLFPDLRRAWFIHDGTDRTGAAALTKLIEAAQKLQIALTPVGVADTAQVAKVLTTVKPGDALLAPDQDGFDIGTAILEKSLEARIPAAFPSALWIEHGGLVAYGPDYYAQGLQAARLVAKILRGARPADLPVESADRIYLTLNLKTAARLGLSVPRKVLVRADSIRE